MSQLLVKPNTLHMIKIKIEGDLILGFEPYFKDFVTVAHIDRNNNEIRPTHGYFPEHPYGKLTKKYAKENGFKYNSN